MYSNVVCDSVWRNENLWIFYNQHKLHCHEWAGNGTEPQSIVKLYIWFLVIRIKNTEANFGGKNESASTWNHFGYVTIVLRNKLFHLNISRSNSFLFFIWL